MSHYECRLNRRSKKVVELSKMGEGKGGRGYFGKNPKEQQLFFEKPSLITKTALLTERVHCIALLKF